MVKEMNELRRDNKDLKIKVTKDKMYINQKEAPSLFETNPLPSPSVDSPGSKYRDMAHTPVKIENGSHFQGHAATIHSPEEAALAREALFQNRDVCTADSIMYAYRVHDANMKLMQGFSDDREWLGGKTLEKILEENNCDNTFLAVSRHHNGPNLGLKRFSLIKDVAKQAIDMKYMVNVDIGSRLQSDIDQGEETPSEIARGVYGI